MPAVVVMETASASLWYHAEKQIVHHQFHQFMHGKEFQEFLLAGMEVLRKNKARKWLSDDRALTALTSADIEWAHNTWFPQTAAAGWKYWAIVQPTKAIGKMNIDRLVKDYLAGGITARYFSDPNEAMSWLEEQ